MTSPHKLLAIAGGSPAFASPLYVGCPNLPEQAAFLKRVNTIYENRWLTNHGPLVREFEAKIAQLAGVNHCVAICNATIALEIAARALQFKGEVIVPSYTFIATPHALQWQEITPVFADIDPQTHNINPNCIEQLLTPRTTGIIGVHIWGRPCDTEAIEAIATRRGLKVMYDAAHAFGCTRKGVRVGSFGACEVFSFHATKFLNSFEGGAVVTNDESLAHRIRLMCNFGFSGYDNVVHPGTNGKMTEICAAMGLCSLEIMDETISINRRNYECYREVLGQLKGLTLAQYDPNEANNYQYVVVEVDPDESPLNRDELISVLHAENVIARKYFWPGCHRMEPYRSCQPHASLLLPQTERLAPRIMVLPTGSSISRDDIILVGDIIKTALSQAHAIRPVTQATRPA